MPNEDFVVVSQEIDAARCLCQLINLLAFQRRTLARQKGCTEIVETIDEVISQARIRWAQAEAEVFRQKGFGDQINPSLCKSN
jgi:hypothetical protein